MTAGLVKRAYHNDSIRGQRMSRIEADINKLGEVFGFYSSSSSRIWKFNLEGVCRQEGWFSLFLFLTAVGVMNKLEREGPAANVNQMVKLYPNSAMFKRQGSSTRRQLGCFRRSFWWTITAATLGQKRLSWLLHMCLSVAVCCPVSDLGEKLNEHIGSIYEKRPGLLRKVQHAEQLPDCAGGRPLSWTWWPFAHLQIKLLNVLYCYSHLWGQKTSCFSVN